jgi:hypothetical protein
LHSLTASHGSLRGGGDSHCPTDNGRGRGTSGTVPSLSRQPKSVNADTCSHFDKNHAENFCKSLYRSTSTQCTTSSNLIETQLARARLVLVSFSLLLLGNTMDLISGAIFSLIGDELKYFFKGFKQEDLKFQKYV